MFLVRAVNNYSSNLHSIFRRVPPVKSDLRFSNLHATSSFCNVGEDINNCFCWISQRRSGSLEFAAASINLGNIGTLRNMSSEACSSKTEKKTNRLILEKSPYLLQHATNPVDWYPWSQEAFDKAKAESKLIFLCHVMEKESFENPSVAEIMNKYFVNIKVDREERPDVDKLYMSFIQATVGGGGWPMSVFLTPDLEPLAGGTYFPPEDKYGRPGFKTVLKNIAEQWRSKQASISSSGKNTIEVLKKIKERDQTDCQRIEVPGEDAWKKCLLQLSKNYESIQPPKFPQPVMFNFLFHMYSRNKKTEQGTQCLQMCLHTLTKMAYGGIHDHVNKGFARYSVDERWHVPHFEKMLYDQAQLAVSYCDAYVLTKDEFYADIVKDILTYVSRDLSHEEGGFYGAEDADSYPFEGAPHKQEGAFCVWEYDEICNLLDEETNGVSHAEVIVYHYDVKKEGNVKPSQDPHGELRNKNVLACFGSYENTADKFQISVESLKNILEKSHSVLYEARQGRPKPDKDTKIVTLWNGLMISAFARSGFVLKDQSYINRAIQAANFIRKYLYDEQDKTLQRCCYRGDDGQIVKAPTPVFGFLDDYAFLIRGLLDLYEASLDADWLQWAETLQEQQDAKFWDSKGSGYFTSPEGDASILIRGKEDQDGAEPSGNSVSVHNLIRLAAYLDREDLRDKAGRTLTAFSDRLNSIPIALPEMVSALMFYHNSPTQVFIAGQTEDNNTQALLDVVRSRFMPGRILAIADGPGGRAGLLYRRHESLSRLRPIQGKPAAYVCRNFACSLPVTEPDDLATSLDDGNGIKRSEDAE
ncbi:hypothetical protein NQ317_005577 [Molorchus minor]|uniref:Spermatogenesis-associated protein 20-like TRX domain-containing protein n=1 Tax=Molorchus minor TaxID=1323400 RepID=A0ABQ9K993_9CUCU|nr:hypothetical protein NQ317_005577 [Molorchus minor]